MSRDREQQLFESGKTVLENLRNLRSFKGDETDFWKQFLYNTAILCKSPVVFVIIKEKDEWAVRHEYYHDEAVKSYKDIFAASAVNIVDRAHQNGFAYERLQFSLPQLTFHFSLVFKIETGMTGEDAVIFVVVDKENVSQFNDIIVRTQLISDIPFYYYARAKQLSAEMQDESDRLLAHSLEVINTVMHKEGFLLSCMTLVNEIAYRFNCSQVGLGWPKADYIRTVAVSHLEDFKRHSEAVRDMEGIFEEVYEQDAMVIYPKMDDRFVIDRKHQAYCRSRNACQIATIPCHMNNKIVAVITCERSDSALSVLEIDTIALILNQVAPWLNALYYKDLWFGSRMALRIKKMLGSWLGAEHTMAKVSAIIISAALLYSFIGEWDYKIEGSADLKTDFVSYIAAPYDGLIHEVRVHEGDEVKKNDFFLKMDTRELLLKEAQVSADVVRYKRESEKSRAGGSLADMKIALSKSDEAQAELDKVRYYLEQAKINAPFDGIVVEGDKQKLVGSPVSKGDILLKIAKVAAMYATIKISEHDISEIAKGAKGQLRLLSRPDYTFGITVDKIVPMAEIDQREGNVFVINARIDDKPMDWWRPGMSGIVKINTGQRKIIWILTHRLMDFIRMYFWW